MKKLLLILFVFLLTGCSIEVFFKDYSKGKELFEAGKFKEAIDILEDIVIQKKTTNEPILCLTSFMLGYSYEQMSYGEINDGKILNKGKYLTCYMQSKYYYQKYLEKYKYDYEDKSGERKNRAYEGIARNEYSKIRRIEKDFDKLTDVIKYMDENINYENNFSSMRLKACIFEQMGKYESALYWHEKSMGKNMEAPWDGIQWSKLGVARCYLALNNRKEAKKAYMFVLVINPMNEEAKKELKLMLMEEGKL